MIYFVTEDRVKSFTTIAGNVDNTLIEPLIPTNADMWYMPILGSFFYNYLLEKYNNKTLTTEEEEIVGVIQKGLIWRVANDIVTNSSIQSTNKGEQKLSGDYSQPANMQQLGFKRHNYQAKAEFYENRLRSFLIRNKDVYPQFTDKRNTDSCLGDITPNTNPKGFTKVRFI